MKFEAPHRGDWTAGLTTAVMLVPQSMAYAMLAGLPAQQGLYAAVVAPLAYAILGRSPYLAVGPAAIDSLLVFAAVGAVADSESASFVVAAASLAVLVGLVQIGFSVSGLHRMASLLSSEMTTGFVSGGALVIACSQLAAVLGISRAKEATVQGALAHAWVHMTEASWPTAVFGAATFALLWLMRRYLRSWPRALVVTALGALVLFFLRWLPVARVGDVPASLPSPAMPDFTYLTSLAPAAVALALVSFAESYSVGMQLADRDDRSRALGPAREFFAIGASNLVTGVFRGYPIAGGLSRSAVNFEAGAKTQWAGAITSLVVALSLLLLSDALYWIPKATLAGIILFAVVKLVDVKAFVRAYQQGQWLDFGVMSATFLVTAGVGAIPGLGVGLGLVGVRKLAAQCGARRTGTEP